MESFNRVTFFELKSSVQVIFCQILPNTQSVAFSLKIFRDCPLVLLISPIKRKIRMKNSGMIMTGKKTEVLGGKKNS
jgi:hypothetical protein